MAVMSRNVGSKEEIQGRRSPFFARNYGGFTKEQEAFYLDYVENPSRKTILDPMGGQGFLLSSLAGKGAKIWLGDINPAPLHLAMLRDPRMVLQRDELTRTFANWFARFKPKRRLKIPSEYSDDWVIPAIQEELREYVSALSSETSPFSYDDAFWSAPPHLRFAACLPILAARNLSCFRSSDNITWLKKGGLVRETTLYEPILRSLTQWSQYAKEAATLYTKKPGTISVRRMNAERGSFADSKFADLIITSPPYANRLDYTRMWAPELEVLSVMWGGGSQAIKGDQIGSTVVEGRVVATQEESILPTSIRRVLKSIRADSEWKASDSYYYPFFRNYALSLAKSLPLIASRLKPGGTFIVFVRDTVRKDIMFPTSELIRSIVLKKLRMSEVGREKRVHRSHVGLLRKSSAGGMYGLAQLEWWLAFRKDS
jgi:hypothetical protein